MKYSVSFLVLLAFITISCSKKASEPAVKKMQIYTLEKFCMGADLSYANQIEDHGGIFMDSSVVRDPFVVFKNHGCNLVRVRLWNNPEWTREVYGTAGTRMYSDLPDVVKTIQRAKARGMGVNLDFHFSDSWADPSNQNIPIAWKDITDLKILEDSVYAFTYNTLRYLDSKGLMPEMVQVGNEINCGMLISGMPAGFPDLNACNGKWQALGEVINIGIKAVRDASVSSAIKPQVILHIADPKNIEWWFDNIKSTGNVKDFDIIGISYYPLWHTVVPFDNLQAKISEFKSRYLKKVMIVETAYPWTTNWDDNYSNQFGSQAALGGFPFTQKGQYDFMVSLTQKVISAGGSGVMVWEPDWITSGLITQWGSGSSMENCAFFDFTGNTIQGIDFMNYQYNFPQ